MGYDADMMNRYRNDDRIKKNITISELVNFLNNNSKILLNIMSKFGREWDRNNLPGSVFYP